MQRIAISRKESRRGFTIVELLIVIVVIGILAAITIVSFSGVSAKAKTSKAQSEASSVLQKLELYHSLSTDSSNGYPIPDQSKQHWDVQSDMSSSDPLTILPSNLRVVRGIENSKDSDGDWTLVSTGAAATPTAYAFVVCSNLATGVQTGVKIAYPNFSTKTVQWLRTGDCPAVPQYPTPPASP